MTTKPSDAPWADEPIKLIPIPAKHLDENTHASVYSACMMAHVHNCLIRGLNAVIQQAPYIPTSVSPAYRPQDVKDLLFYVASWVRTVEHHHHTEETTMFPAIEEFAGEPGLMEGPKHQHEEFTPGLEKLLAYAQETKPEDYRWEGGGGMKDIIDGFTEPLTRHLFDEIDVFLGVGHLDTQGLRKCWDEAEKAAQAKGNRQILVSGNTRGYPDPRCVDIDSTVIVRHLSSRSWNLRPDL